MNTYELTGAALDWAVAKCEAYRLDLVPEGSYSPSTDWAQGGPIIEREGIDIIMVQRDLQTWAAEIYETPMGYKRQQATSPLIAAMRCYVAFKMGETVELPQELMQ